MALGVDAPVPTYAEATARQYDDRERTYIRSQRARLVLGNPDTVRTKLVALAAEYAADELMILTITGDYQTRRRSYELVAKAFELS
jgi:alkanesulfonate monooxygenase SsuD/methylene tetrahydromethanopterin reductase-like flavin-dependent oxidoreductase (luciferase family)